MSAANPEIKIEIKTEKRLQNEGRGGSKKFGWRKKESRGTGGRKKSLSIGKRGRQSYALERVGRIKRRTKVMGATKREVRRCGAVNRRPSRKIETLSRSDSCPDLYGGSELLPAFVRQKGTSGKEEPASVGKNGESR